MSTSGHPTFPGRPIPNTAISAMRMRNDTGDRVFYQGMDGFIYYTEQLDKQKDATHIGPTPIRIEGQPGTLAPLAVQYNVNLNRVEAYYQDKNAILRQAKVENKPGFGAVQLEVLDWLNIKADNTSKIACLSARYQEVPGSPFPRGGSWVYYQSGTEKAIREIWDQTPPPPMQFSAQSYEPLERESRNLRCTTFSASDILLGTSIAATIVRIPDPSPERYRELGSFYFQRDDGCIFRCFWNNGWQEHAVVKPGTEYSAVFHTGLAATFSTEREREYLVYVTTQGQLHLCSVDVSNGKVQPDIPRVCQCLSPPLPGTSLAITAKDHANGDQVLLRIHYQNIDGWIETIELPV